MRFRVLTSGHSDKSTGKKYEKGEIVEDDRELDKLFKNKFKRLGNQASKPVKPNDVDDRLNQSGGRQGDKPLGTRRPTRGQPPEDKPTRKVDPKNTDYIEDEDQEEEDEEEGENPDPEPGTTTEAEKVEEEDENEGAALGDDVTEQFPKASPAEMKVYRKGRTYTIVEEDDDSKVLNTEPLTSKKAVEDFIKDNKNR